MEDREYSNMKEIFIDKIIPNPEQPRKHFDQASLQELAESIKEYGVIEPIIVKPIINTEGSYMLVAGERRWRAAKLAGKIAIPAIVRNIDAQKAKMIALIENLQREDLALSDEIPRICELVEFYGGNVREAAKKINKSITYVNDRLVIKDIPEEIRSLLDGGQLTILQAKVISQIPDTQAQMNAAGLAVRLELDANQLYARIQRDIPEDDREKISVKSEATTGSRRHSFNNSGSMTSDKVVSALVNAYDTLERYDFNLINEEKKQLLRKQIKVLQKILERTSQRLG